MKALVTYDTGDGKIITKSYIVDDRFDLEEFIQDEIEEHEDWLVIQTRLND